MQTLVRVEAFSTSKAGGMDLAAPTPLPMQWMKRDLLEFLLHEAGHTLVGCPCWYGSRLVADDSIGGIVRSSVACSSDVVAAGGWTTSKSRLIEAWRSSSFGSSGRPLFLLVSDGGTAAVQPRLSQCFPG